MLMEYTSALATTVLWMICWLDSCMRVWFNIVVFKYHALWLHGADNAHRWEWLKWTKERWWVCMRWWWWGGGGGGWKIKIAHRFSSASCSTETALPPLLPVTQPSSQSAAIFASIQRSNMFLMVKDSCMNVHITFLLKGRWVAVRCYFLLIQW